MTAEKRRKALNYKKFMDVMLHIFACLREPSGDREPLKLCARDFYCVLVPHDGDASPAELRDTVDLSELYSRAKVRSRERPAGRPRLERRKLPRPTYG